MPRERLKCRLVDRVSLQRTVEGVSLDRSKVDSLLRLGPACSRCLL